MSASHSVAGESVAPDIFVPVPQQQEMPLALVRGQPVLQMPQDLYIPPDALEVILEAFEGPLDLLLYLIRRQNFNILDIPLASVTRQYLAYVEQIRSRNLELAADYLLMAAMLIEIKSRMLLPPKKTAEGEEAEDPRAELVRRLLEYEQMKAAAFRLNEMPQLGRDVLRAQVYIEQSLQPRFPDVEIADLTGDGIADIVFRHSVSGANVVWLMDSKRHRRCGTYFNPPTLADLNWILAGPR